MTATLAVRPTAQAQPAAVRVVPAPRTEPLTDDELRSRGLDAPAAGAPLLPLDLPGVPARRRPRLVTLPGQTMSGAGTAHPDDREVDAAVPAGGWSAPAADRDSAAGHPRATEVAVRAATSPARAATRLFLATCVEVIGGFRAMSQLRPLCVPDRFTDIADRLAAHPSTAPAGRTGALAYRTTRSPLGGRMTGAPPRVPRHNRTAPTDRAGVRRVQICDIGPRVAEVAVVLGRRDQVWAMALRFEIHRGQWLCSLLEVI